MADAFYSAWMEIVPDFSKVSKEIDDAVQGIGRDFGRAGERAGDAFADRANPAFEGIGRDSGNRFTSGFGKFIGGVGIGTFLGNFASNAVSFIGDAIGTGLRAGMDYLTESVEQASGLTESLNAISVAYGDAAGEIERLAAGAASRLGLSQLDFQSIATQFSSFAATIRGNDVAGFIDELTTRGADFASVYNIEVSEALALFQSGLAGETEPLRKFGIDLSAAAVEAYAYASGIAAAGVPLSEAEKQQARYGLLLEQTAKTAGDFTNTQDSLANQQRILNAEWENAQAKLGMAMLPALTTLAQVANDTLVPVLNDVIDKVGPQLATALSTSAPAFADMLVQVAPLLPELFRLGAEALPPILALITALSPVIIDWATNSSSMMAVLNGLFALLSGDTSLEDTAGEFVALGGSTFDALRGVLNFAIGAANAVAGFAREVGARVNEAVGFFQSLPARIQGFFAGAGSWLVSSGRALIQGFIDGISAMVGRVGDAVGKVLSFARGFFPNSPADRGPFSGAGWRQIANSGAAIFDQFTGGFDAQAGALAMPGMSALAPRVALPRMGSLDGGVASSGGFPSSLVLRVGDREFTAYVQAQAAGVVSNYERSTARASARGSTGY